MLSIASCASLVHFQTDSASSTFSISGFVRVVRDKLRPCLNERPGDCFAFAACLRFVALLWPPTFGVNGANALMTTPLTGAHIHTALPLLALRPLNAERVRVCRAERHVNMWARRGLLRYLLATGLSGWRIDFHDIRLRSSMLSLNTA